MFVRAPSTRSLPHARTHALAICASICYDDVRSHTVHTHTCECVCVSSRSVHGFVRAACEHITNARTHDMWLKFHATASSQFSSAERNGSIAIPCVDCASSSLFEHFQPNTSTKCGIFPVRCVCAFLWPAFRQSVLCLCACVRDCVLFVCAAVLTAATVGVPIICGLQSVISRRFVTSPDNQVANRTATIWPYCRTRRFAGLSNVNVYV